MGDLFRRGGVIFVTGLVAAGLAWSSLAQAQGEPPARVGRLAFTNGPVSFHDEQQSGWTPVLASLCSALIAGRTRPLAKKCGPNLRISGAYAVAEWCVSSSIRIRSNSPMPLSNRSGAPPNLRGAAADILLGLGWRVGGGD